MSFIFNCLLKEYNFDKNLLLGSEAFVNLKVAWRLNTKLKQKKI